VTRKFDERRGTAFCIMDALDAETAQCMHWEAHGFIAGEVVEVALTIEVFLGRIQDPAAAWVASKKYGRRPPSNPFQRYYRFNRNDCPPR